MTEELEISNIAKETIDILKYFDPVFISKIPAYLLNNLKELAKQSNIMLEIDNNKKLKDQKISEQTKDMISLLYYSYIATEQEKEEIKNSWDNNELLYQEELRKKYNPDNIFKKIESVHIEKNEKAMIVVNKKDSILHTLLNKIKNLFRI